MGWPGRLWGAAGCRFAETVAVAAEAAQSKEDLAQQLNKVPLAALQEEEKGGRTEQPVGGGGDVHACVPIESNVQESIWRPESRHALLGSVCTTKQRCSSPLPSLATKRHCRLKLRSLVNTGQGEGCLLSVLQEEKKLERITGHCTRQRHAQLKQRDSVER